MPCKLHNALVPAGLVRVSIGHLACAPHEVLQILPARLPSEVADVHFSAGARATAKRADHGLPRRATSWGQATAKWRWRVLLRRAAD